MSFFDEVVNAFEVAELAWAAGFFDGEGHIGRHTHYDNLFLSISQKRIEPLERFRNALGQGGTFHVRKHDGIYTYNVWAKRKVHRALDLLWPFLSLPKVEQALAAGYMPQDVRNDPLAGYYALLEEQGLYDEAVA